jgi:hypothetical protein
MTTRDPAPPLSLSPVPAPRACTRLRLVLARDAVTRHG